MTDVGEYVEKEEPLFTASGGENAIMEISLEIPQKIENRMSI